MNLFKKNKDYIKVILISFIILLGIFISKNIFPFGSNSLIYGDMYEQITSFYYYFYDAFHSSTSLLVNFNISSGINFFTTICYYILSPFSFIVLLVKRSEIHLVVSIIVALKIILCSTTCLYMLKKLFKNLNSACNILLAVSYAFCAYALNYYQITAWIDCMYLLPLIVVGLKNIFDNDNPRLYIIAVTLAICMSFYLSAITIIFIFLLSLFYIYVYKKEDFGKKILQLGISTILSIAASAVILLPTIKEYSLSSRTISFLETLANSKLGPLTDKLTLFLFGPILFIFLLLLFKDYKKHKDFLKFYVPTLLLLLIPVICEPINKMLHFGSYYFFTYRFGFITSLFMVIGAAYYLNKAEVKEELESKKNIIISVFIVIATFLISFILCFKKYNLFQKYIELLSLSTNKQLLLILIFIFGLTFIAGFIVLVINKGITKKVTILLALLTISHIYVNSYLYLGIDFVQENDNLVYKDLNLIYEDRDLYGNYRYKNETAFIIKNHSNVSSVAALDQFNSLNGASNQDILKRLGYTSFQSRTHSLGGTLFTDILLGNKYILNKGEEKEYYTKFKEYDNLAMHELNMDVSYGYLVNNNDNLNNLNNTFEVQNAIYNSITNDTKLFEIIDEGEPSGLKIEDNKYILDGSTGSITYTVDVKEKRKVYVELLGGINFSDNRKIYEKFAIKVNDKELAKEYPTIDDNGILDLGTHENTTLKIEVIFSNDCILSSLNIGLMNMEKLNNFVDTYTPDIDITFNKNHIDIKVNTDKEKILFLPLSYSNSYKAYNNDKNVEIIKMYDNFIGIKLQQGENNISLKYVPQYLIPGLIISVITIILILILLNTNLYNNLIDIKFLQKLSKWIYLILYIIILVILYIIPGLMFVISFVKYIRI